MARLQDFLHEQTTPEGARIIVLRRPGSGVVDVRLALPFARVVPGLSAPMELLAACLVDDCRTRQDMAEHAGSVRAALGPEELVVSAGALASGTEPLIAAVTEAATAARYTLPAVDRARRRLASRPRTGLGRRTELLLEGWPGAAAFAPAPADALAETGPGDLEKTHLRLIAPAGAVLVIVGDVIAEQAMEAACGRLSGWRGAPPCLDLPERELAGAEQVAFLPEPGEAPTEMVLHGPAPKLGAPGHAAFHLANLLVAGFFSGRLVQRLRHRAEIAYQVDSSIRRFRRTAWTEISARAVAGTRPDALLQQTSAALDELAESGPAPGELEAARRFSLGTLRTACTSGGALADAMTGYALSGEHPLWMLSREESLAAAGAGEVTDEIRARLTPRSLSGVVSFGTLRGS
ncbi:insulinase family protein [Nocardiopsis sp. CNT-189]|uniref:M16 family metallopeptidase n=1 Tax=Nocardiopsis oceanisediminis TaxID=2816862 RepID=UPI003B368430